MEDSNQQIIDRAVKIAARLKRELEAEGKVVPVSLDSQDAPTSVIMEAMAVFIAFCALIDYAEGVPVPAIQHGMSTFQHAIQMAGSFDKAILQVREQLELPLADDAAQQMMQISVTIVASQVASMAGMAERMGLSEKVDPYEFG